MHKLSYVLAFALCVALSRDNCVGKELDSYMLHAVSASGQYRFEYAHDHTEDLNNKGSLSRVIVSLRDQQEGSLQWSIESKWPLQKVPDRLRASQIYVSDWGTVVYFTMSGGIVAMDRNGSTLLYSHSASAVLFGDGAERGLHSAYVNSLALVFFEGSIGSERFYCRNLTRSLLLDVDTGQAESQQSAFPAEVAEVRKRLLALKSLPVAGRSKGDTWPSKFDAAIFWSDLLQSEEAATILSDISDRCFIGERYASERDPRLQVAATAIPSPQRVLLSFALLRAGAEPRRSSVVPILLSSVEANIELASLKDQAARSVGFSSLVVGDSSAKCVDLMGCPDFVWEDTWAYDLSSQNGTTAIVQFVDGLVVAAYETSPPIQRSAYAKRAVYSLQSLAPVLNRVDAQKLEDSRVFDEAAGCARHDRSD